MTVSLNIPNLDKLIAHLEAQPPERINMGHVVVEEHPCGTCGCIIGHSDVLWPEIADNDFDETDGLAGKLGLNFSQTYQLTHPAYWRDEEDGVKRYPAHRVIATLKRLRDRFLATGEIVVDWGADPDAGEPWAAPKAIEITQPELPEEITRLLGGKVEVA